MILPYVAQFVTQAFDPPVVLVNLPTSWPISGLWEVILVSMVQGVIMAMESASPHERLEDISYFVLIAGAQNAPWMNQNCDQP